MPGMQTLPTLIKVKAAEIQRLLTELSCAEAQLSSQQVRYDELTAERDCLEREFQRARLNSTSLLQGRRITAHDQQLQHEEVGRLGSRLKQATERQSTAFAGLEQGRRDVDALRLQLTEHIGQKRSYEIVGERAQRTEALRQERAADDELLELWSSRSRPG